MVMTQGMTDLANLIRARRSIRQWQDKSVPEELLLQAIELATWTPNNGNQQNWRFYVVTNRASINAIADAVEAVSAETSSWPEIASIAPPRPANAPPPRKPGFFRQAPVLIIVGSNRVQTPQDRALEERGKYDPRALEIREWRNSANARLQTIGGLSAYLCLALHQVGLGAVWLTGLIQAKGEIEKLLKMPETMDVCACIPVGYPAETPVSRGRKQVSEVCEFVR